MLIYKEFSFDSAHFLPCVPQGHKCKELHGHTYRLTVFIEGEVQEESGWILDFGVLKNAIDPVIRQVDHKLLNDLPGLENPTCELLAKWLWKKTKAVLPGLKRIDLKETATSGVIFEG